MRGVGGVHPEGVGVVCEVVLVGDGLHAGEGSLVVPDEETVDDGDSDLPNDGSRDEHLGAAFHLDSNVIFIRINKHQ